MNQCKRPGVEFVVDSNVHIEVMSPQNVITQTVERHNKATKQLVEGLLRFIRGEFNTSYKRTKEKDVVYKSEAKKYIPCYIGVGTGGIRINPTTHLPDYDTETRRTPPMETLVGSNISWWDQDDNFVRFTDKKLYLEETETSRYEIGVLGEDESSDSLSQVGDIEQIILATDIAPGTFNHIYTEADTTTADIFITEIGLFASSVPGTEDLLARTILKNHYNEQGEVSDTQILYVRPQDTIIIRWTISIIALDDSSFVDDDTDVTIDNGITADVPAGTAINNTIPYSGPITYIPDEHTNETENEEPNNNDNSGD